MAKKIVYSSVLLLLGIIFFIPATTPAHGQFTGTICIIPTSSSSCPSSPATVGGTVGTQLRVSVFIQNSDGLDGFDVTLLADHTILKPAGADLSGTVLQGPQTVLIECLGGVLVQGNTCSGTDTPDTLHFVAVNCLGCPNTSTPTTGLLFTAIYNITATTSGTPIGYQTGCNPPTSVANTCITISNGTPTPDPENAQTAVFTTGDFTISANPASLSLRRNSQATSTMTLNSISFDGTVSITATVSPTNKAPSRSLSMSTVTLTSGGTGSVTLTVATAKNTGFGTYVVTVTGNSGTIVHSVTVTVTVTH